MIKNKSDLCDKTKLVKNISVIPVHRQNLSLKLYTYRRSMAFEKYFPLTIISEHRDSEKWATTQIYWTYTTIWLITSRHNKFLYWKERKKWIHDRAKYVCMAYCWSDHSCTISEFNIEFVWTTNDSSSWIEIKSTT